MATLNMDGPYLLTNAEIDRVVKKGSIGNYAVGKIEAGEIFIVMKIGRSETDLNLRLKDLIKDFPYFKFSTETTTINAFEKECKNYHDFIEQTDPDKTNHPQRPEGKHWKCPFCYIFD